MGAEGTGGRRCLEVDLPTEDSSNATEGLRMMPKDREAQRSPRSSDGLRMMPKDCESRRSPRSSGGLRMMLKVRRFSKNQEDTRRSGADPKVAEDLRDSVPRVDNLYILTCKMTYGPEYLRIFCTGRGIKVIM